MNAVDNKLEFPHSYNYDTTVFPKNMNNQTVQVNSRIPMSNLPFSIWEINDRLTEWRSQYDYLRITNIRISCKSVPFLCSRDFNRQIFPQKFWVKSESAPAFLSKNLSLERVVFQPSKCKKFHFQPQIWFDLTHFPKWLRKSAKSLLYKTKKLRNSE